MKITAVYGSARKNGNGAFLADLAVKEFEKRGAAVEKVWLSDITITSCAGCFACRKREMCIRNDDMTKLFEKIKSSDYVIFATPIYMLSASGAFQMMLNRMYPLLDGNPGFYSPRHPKMKCMLIITQGAPLIMLSSARLRIHSIIKSFGFKTSMVSLGLANNIGTVQKSSRSAWKIKRIINALYKQENR